MAAPHIEQTPAEESDRAGRRGRAAEENWRTAP